MFFIIEEANETKKKKKIYENKGNIISTLEK